MTLLESVTAHTRACLAYLDRDFGFVWVNQAYADSCSRAVESFVGHNHFELFPHEENETIFRRVRDSGIPYAVKAKVFEHPDRSGTLTYWDWTLTPVGGPGRVQGLVLSLVDVTEDVLRRQEIEVLKGEAEARASETQAILSQMTEGVIVYDPGGIVRYVNEAGRRLFGVPNAEPPGSINSSSVRFIHLNGRPVDPEESPLRRSLSGETVIDWRCKIVTRWGRRFFLSVCSGPVYDSRHQLVGAVSVYRDFTEQELFDRRREELYQREHRITLMLQEALVPVGIPRAMHGCRFWAEYEPASADASIGGDFYDVFQIDDRLFGVIIGDVAGKGLSAAMRVSAARYTIRGYAYIEHDLSKVLSLANETLCARTSEEDLPMLTAFFGVFDAVTGEFRYCNAGHEPPVLRRADGTVAELWEGGTILGALSGMAFDQASVQLETGDLVLMMTDGITEARTSDDRMLGKERVMSFIASARGADADGLIADLLCHAREYAGGALQDDAAILAFSPGLS